MTKLNEACLWMTEELLKQLAKVASIVQPVIFSRHARNSDLLLPNLHTETMSCACVHFRWLDHGTLVRNKP